MAARAEARVPGWQRGRVASWLVTTDHKRIGILYIWTSFLFFILAGLMALVFRLQLAQANAGVVGPERYNELVTIHGTAMVFLVVVPLFAGLANFLVPLMIGARDVAFPRLNALSYWLFFLGGAVLMLSFFADGGAADTGWTAYPPLSAQAPGNGQDLWILSLHILTASSLAGAINFIVTIHHMRTRGMTLDAHSALRLGDRDLRVAARRDPARPGCGPHAAPARSRHLDRRPGSSRRTSSTPQTAARPCSTSTRSGSSATPRCTSSCCPAFGIISEVLPVFARKPVFGYKAIALSTVAIGFFSMLVWAHHMFTVGLPIPLQAFFMIASMVIAVPTGMKIFNWLATLWRGNLVFETPMLFALGFISVFVIGGLTGIYLAAFPVDWQVHDTYFVVAHFHYTMVGGSLFAIFAALYYWWPKMFGRTLDEQARQVALLAALRRVQPHVLPAAPARARGDAAPHLHVRERGLGGVQPRVDRRLLAHGDRDPHLRLERDQDAAARAARRERPLAGGHARVVHDLAAAAPQLRPGAVRDERPSPLRSATEAPRRRWLQTAHLRPPGQLLRLSALVGAVGTGLVVTSAVLELGAAHWGLAAIVLPALVVNVLAARYAYPALLVRAAATLGALPRRDRARRGRRLERRAAGRRHCTSVLPPPHSPPRC